MVPLLNPGEYIDGYGNCTSNHRRRTHQVLGGHPDTLWELSVQGNQAAIRQIDYRSGLGNLTGNGVEEVQKLFDYIPRRRPTNNRAAESDSEARRLDRVLMAVPKLVSAIPELDPEGKLQGPETRSPAKGIITVGFPRRARGG
jgi:hypothetical protein